MKNKQGFTLIELLIVVVIVFILGAIIYVAIDPKTRFGDARNARRRSEVVAILNAVLKYQVDNNGAMPAAIDAVTSTSQVLGTDKTGCNLTCAATNTVSACADLTSALVNDYLAAMPVDPMSGKASNTGYYINKTTSGRVLVGACEPENAATISVTR